MLTWLCVASCGSESFLLVDMSWQEGQDVGWQEGHCVTPNLSEGLSVRGAMTCVMLRQVLLQQCNNTQL